MNLLVLSASDLRSALPMGDAIEAVKSGFAALSTGQACAPLRSVVPAEPADGVTLLMGAYLPQVGTSAKVVSVFHRNRQLGKNVVNALVVVMDPNTGEPVALCDGTYLTALRTGAASGAATELLARPDARVGAIIGCGEGVFPHAPMAGDVFKHHDGVIQEHAYSEGYAPERHDVEGDIGPVHQVEGRYHRYRNGEGYDHGGRETS